MKLESLKSNKNIINLAKANVLLLEEMEETKQFVETFNRNFSNRIHEHIKAIDLLVSNLVSINELSDKAYSDLTADLGKEAVQKLIQEQLELEIDKRRNVKALDEQLSYVMKLFETVSNVIIDSAKKIGTIAFETTILRESSLVEDNKQINENYGKYVSAVKTFTSSMTQSLNECCSKMITSCNDLSTTALTSLKSNTINEQKALHDTFGWWKQGLQSIEQQFRHPKNVILNVQKAIALTEQELQSMKREYLNAR